MRLRSLFIAAAFVVGLAVYGAGGASAASAVVTPQQAIVLGQQADRLATRDLTEVRKRRYRGHRRYRRHRGHRRYRHHRRYRRHRGHRRYRHHRRYRSGPRVHLYVPYYRGRRYGRGARYGRCGYWRRQCARNWGTGNANYFGCLRYHRCR